MDRILIAITTAETVCHEVMEAIYNLIIPENVKVDIKIIHSYDVSNGRKDLVNHSIQNNYDYIFFVDSDVILPIDSLHLLYESINKGCKKYIMNGTYPRKEISTITSEDPFTTLYRHDPSNMAKYNYNPFFLPVSELPEFGVIPVDCAGLGCTLIKMELFTKILHNVEWFKFADEHSIIDVGPYCLGEDMWFYRECIKRDIQPYAHGGVRCGHIGKFIYELPKS